MKFRDVGCLALLLGLMSGAAACNGVIPDSEGGQDPTSEPGGAKSGGRSGSGGSAGAPLTKGLFTCDPGAQAGTPKRIWRLSPVQYRNTVASLFEGSEGTALMGKDTSPFDDEAVVDRFSTFSRAHLIGDLAFGRVTASASNLASEYVRYLKGKNQACVGSGDFAACAIATVETAGEKLFRRPLEAVEVAQYKKLLSDGRALLGDEQGLALVLESLFLSPSFLYRVELGAGEPDDAGRTRLTAYETAAAISYSLTDGPPDEILRKAAKANALSTVDDVRAQVERLASTPRHKAAVLRFLKEYFRYGAALDVFKDDKAFPFHEASLLVDDTDRWLAEVYEQKGRDNFVRGLLTFDQVVVRGKTATNYNLEGVVGTDAAPKMVAPPGNQRVGILTQPSFLTALSHSESNDPVRRGLHVAGNFLCVDIPSLPIGLVPELPEPTADSTLRDRLRQHVEDPTCNGCHKLMDPIGLGFEGYDHVGRVRTMEGGKPVNTQGVLVGASPEEPFEGVAQLADKLAASTLVSQCFVRHGFSYWLGRSAEEADGCALQKVHDDFTKSGQDHVALLASLFASDSFLLRRP